MLIGEVENSLKEWYTKLEKLWRVKTPKARNLFEKAKKVFPGGISYAVRFLSPYPFYVIRAKDVYLWDIDNNTYIDFWLGHGAMFLGHSFEVINDSVKEQLSKGSHYGFSHPYEIDLAELITKYVPNVEKVRFTNSGTEAVMYTVRLVRAFTKKKKIVKIEGGWHGGYDALHKATFYPFTVSESAGLPEEAISHTYIVPYNDIESMEKILKTGEVAAVILEPILGAGGAITPKNNYLKAVRELCDKYGALLVFDEIITGFRVSLGGAQEVYGVNADIVILGKIVGGGYPIGVFGGREDIMELLDQIKIKDKAKRAFHGGTFTGNPISMVAGKAVIEFLSKNKHVYEHVNYVGNYLIKGLITEVRYHDLPIHITGVSSLLAIHFTKQKPWNAREVYELRWSNEMYKTLNMFMRLKNIAFLTEKLAHLFISIKHEKQHVEKFVEAFSEFLTELKKFVNLKKIKFI